MDLGFGGNNRELFLIWTRLERYHGPDQRPLFMGEGPFLSTGNSVQILEIDLAQLRSVAKLALKCGFSLIVDVQRYVASGVKVVLITDLKDDGETFEYLFHANAFLPSWGYWRCSGVASATVPGRVVGLVPLAPLGTHDIAIFRRHRSGNQAVYIGSVEATVTTEHEITQPLVIDLRE